MPTTRGLSVSLSYDPADDVAAPFIATGARPQVAILREQGVNGHASRWLRPSTVPASAAVDGVHERHPRRPCLPGTSVEPSPAAASPTATSSAPARAGAHHPLQRPRPRRVLRLLRPSGYLRTGRLQRLPDDERAEVAGAGAEHWPRFVAATVLSSSRRVSTMVEIPESPSLLPRRHGRQPHAGGRLAWRGPCRLLGNR